jgi:hypothetical protein
MAFDSDDLQQTELSDVDRGVCETFTLRLANIRRDVEFMLTRFLAYCLENTKASR